MHLAGERISAQPQVVGAKSVFSAQLIAAFIRRKIRCAEGNQSDLGFASLDHLRPWDERTCRLKFPVEPFHIVEIIVRSLRVLGLLVVTTAACEVSRKRMVGARQRPIAYAVSVYILITGESAQFPQILSAQDHSAFQWVALRTKWFGHPVVHSQVEVGHDKNW